MEWIRNSVEFDGIFSRARCALSALTDYMGAKAQKISFDDAQISTRSFLKLLQTLMRSSGDESAYYLVLSPDPVGYFYRHFHKSPLLQIGLEDSGEDYLKFLHEDPGQSLADAIGTNWSEAVIFSDRTDWLIQAYRKAEDDGGQLWVPSSWVPALVKEYSFLRK